MVKKLRGVKVNGSESMEGNSVMLHSMFDFFRRSCVPMLSNSTISIHLL